MTIRNKIGALSLLTWFSYFKGRIPKVLLACIEHLREHFPSVRISIEVERPGRAGLEDLARTANVVFYSKSWAIVSYMIHLSSFSPLLGIITNSSQEQRILIYRDMFASAMHSNTECVNGWPSPSWINKQRLIFHTNTRSLLLCTWGEDGAGALEPDTGKFVHVAAYTREGFEVIEWVLAFFSYFEAMESLI